MRVELVTIGNELLIGQTVDTNSAWMAQQLNLAGIMVSRITSVHDSREDIMYILKETEERADIVILTGGLGPTSDDITKPVLCEFFDTRLVFSTETFEHIQRLLAKRDCKINENNKRQAEIPESAILIKNDNGTAPGLWFEKSGKIFISLPGVPHEMKTLLNERVIPKLKEKGTFPHIYYKTVITQGSFEAHLAEMLKDFESEMPENISLAYLPSPGIIRLRFSMTGENYNELKNEVERQVKKLGKIIPEFIVGYDNESLEMIVGNLLKYNHQSLSVAESCTGGAIASLITSVPGSSVYFKGGIVAYSNEIKRDQLAIDSSLIDKYGAVSKPVVEHMADNTRLLFNTDYSVAVSGIAGPAGGTDEKPVGMTWIAVSCKTGTRSDIFRFSDNREINIRRASMAALNMLRKLIIDQNVQVTR